MAGAAGLASAASAFNPWTAAAAAVPAIFQGVSGIVQANKGKRMAQKNVRPIYARPTEVGQGLALAEQNYMNGGLPGESGLVNQVSSANANALDNSIQAASSGGDVLDAITKLNYNEQNQLNSINNKRVTYKDQQLADYQNQLQNSAQYTDKEFAYNQDAPYQDRAASASALINAGNQNIGSAVNGLGSLATVVGLNGGFNGNSETPQISNSNTLAALPDSAQNLLVRGNTNQLAGLPTSNQGLRVAGSNPSPFSMASMFGKKMVWDPIAKKMKVSNSI